MRRPTQRLARTIALLLLAAPGCAAPRVAQEAAPATVIYLVRHAETAPDGTNDPPLSDAGRARADRLAQMFADEGLTAVHTTAYRRTRATAAPVAKAVGLVELEYDPRDLARFAAKLREEGGRHLVVGHSNTTPELVRALGGEAEPMPETEFARVYRVVVRPDGVETTLTSQP